MKNAIIFSLALLLTIPLGMLEAYSLSLLWRWYAVPYFGAFAVPYVAFFGLSLFVGLISKYLPLNGEDTLKQLSHNVAMAILRPLLAIFFGWLFLFIFA